MSNSASCANWTHFYQLLTFWNCVKMCVWCECVHTHFLQNQNYLQPVPDWTLYWKKRVGWQSLENLSMVTTKVIIFFLCTFLENKKGIKEIIFLLSSFTKLYFVHQYCFSIFQLSTIQFQYMIIITLSYIQIMFRSCKVLYL